MQCALLNCHTIYLCVKIISLFDLLGLPLLDDLLGLPPLDDLLGLPLLDDLLGLPLLDDLLGLLLDAARRHGLGHLVADVEELHLVQDVWQQRLVQVTDHLTRDQQHRQLLQPTNG